MVLYGHSTEYGDQKRKAPRTSPRALTFLRFPVFVIKGVGVTGIMRLESEGSEAFFEGNATPIVPLPVSVKDGRIQVDTGGIGGEKVVTASKAFWRKD